jgi:glycosyltransferase involved in cell wall biosynthesis
MPSRADLRRLRTAFGLVVADLDDAIYAVPPSVGASPILPAVKAGLRAVVRGSPHASSRRRPLARTLASVDACVVGNSILARFAGRYADRVLEIPTTVAPADRPQPAPSDSPVLVWIGLPANQQYLRLITAPLIRLSREADFVLRVVSSSPWAEAPVPIDYVSYSEDAARLALLESTVGLAPLTDDPWTRGKCAMRAIQYGGSGLPCVASPVGITDEVVIHGETGFLARTEDDWLEGLRVLLADPGRAAAMGLAAWERVRRLYSNEVAVARWRSLLRGLWGQSPR